MTSETSAHRRSKRALKGTAVGLALLVGLGSVAHAETIVVQGNRRVDTETIKSYVTGQSAEQARKDLLATGLFSSVSVTGRPGSLVVSVKENEVINRVVFQGAKKLKPEQLSQEVQSKARGPFSQTVVDSDVERLKQIYKAGGRGNAAVSARVVPLDNGRVDVVFDIAEGD